MNQSRTEYRIVELGVGENFRHGYQGWSAKAAKLSLQHMQDTYGKYGRVFSLEKRQIEDWHE